MNFVFISSFITLIGFMDCFCLNKKTTISARIENTEITKLAVAGVGGLWALHGDICGWGIRKDCWQISDGVKCYNGNRQLSSWGGEEIGICR
jgi:hypothetical protein